MTHSLSGDRPQDDPAEDRLDYAPFARHLADAICGMTPSEGLVIALYGPWGSGKSTVVNFVLHYINQVEEAKRPIIVNFNPWWFSGHEELVRRFFGQLELVFRKWRVVGKAVLDKLATLGDIVSQVPVEPVSLSGKLISRARPKTADIVALRESISKALLQQDRKVLVVLDDIDRLSSDEVREIFRLIKSVANFPNVVYLLAFDKKVAVKAVKSMQGVPGEEYLEKIVQVPFELPLPEKAALRKLLFARLDEVLLDTAQEDFNQSYWQNVYFEGIDLFINTPRDIVRLINTLSVTYGAVKGEVNPVDFIAIESLRLFASEVYDVIRRSKDSFSGASSGATGLGIPVNQLRPFHDAWLAEVPASDRGAVQTMLKRIFPKMQAIWGNNHFGNEWLGQWRKELRVCSPDVFPVYFRLDVPSGALSNSEIKGLLTLIPEQNAFGARLISLADERRLAAFLNRLEDYTSDAIAEGEIASVLGALFDIGDELLRRVDEPVSMFTFGLDVSLGRIVFQLLKRFPDEAVRFELLRSAIEAGRAVCYITDEVAVLGQQHGKLTNSQPDPEDQRLVNPEHLAALEEIALRKIRAAASDNTLLDSPSLASVLFRWKDWAGDEEPRAWAEAVTRDDAALLRFLKAFVQTRLSQSLGSIAVTRNRYVNLQLIGPFLSTNDIRSRVEALSKDASLSDADSELAKLFLEGRDGDSPWL